MENKILISEKNPISEARRYVENAKQTLLEHGNLDTELKRYNDRKYVKAAGHYLWSAVLIMLDAVFQVKSPQHPHPDVMDYKKAVAARDRKLLVLVNDAYETTHIFMGYDGVQNKDVCDAGFRLVNNIIDRCEVMIPAHVA